MNGNPFLFNTENSPFPLRNMHNTYWGFLPLGHTDIWSASQFIYYTIVNVLVF